MAQAENNHQKLIDLLGRAEEANNKNQIITHYINQYIKDVNKKRNEVLVDLINAHNPYTKNDYLPNAVLNEAQKDNIWHMNIFCGNPNVNNREKNNISQIELEVDGPYTMGSMEWNFKGSPQKINKTIRIKYRYRARDLQDPNMPALEPEHWVTAYLLIGYEDGGA